MPTLHNSPLPHNPTVTSDSKYTLAPHLTAGLRHECRSVTSDFKHTLAPQLRAGCGTLDSVASVCRVQRSIMADVVSADFIAGLCVTMAMKLYDACALATVNKAQCKTLRQRAEVIRRCLERKRRSDGATPALECLERALEDLYNYVQTLKQSIGPRNFIMGFLNASGRILNASGREIILRTLKDNLNDACLDLQLEAAVDQALDMQELAAGMAVRDVFHTIFHCRCSNSATWHMQGPFIIWWCDARAMRFVSPCRNIDGCCFATRRCLRARSWCVAVDPIALIDAA